MERAFPFPHPPTFPPNREVKTRGVFGIHASIYWWLLASHVMVGLDDMYVSWT